MIEITVNDRLGKKVRIKCNQTDTIGGTLMLFIKSYFTFLVLKLLIAAQTGTRFALRMRLSWNVIIIGRTR